MITSISTSQIKYIIELEKTGSFSKAAETCFITQSTLSTMIKKMEDQMGLIIFDRRSKPIQLTQEGRALIDQLKVIHHEFENLKELIQESKEEFHGSLKIGIIPTIAPFLLPLFLDKLVSNYPDVNFNIHEITTNDIARKIKLRELDIGILSLPIDGKEFKEIDLFKEDFLVYDASGHAGKKKYKINDIDLSRLWLLEEGHCLTNQIEKICHLRKKRKINNNLVYNSGSILSLLELVNMNKGITLLPRLATKINKLIKEEFICDMESPKPVRRVGMITHQNFAKKRFLDILEKEIKESVKPYLSKARKIKIINPF